MHSTNQNAILEAIFAESTLGIIVTNRHGKIIKLNEEAEQLFAYPSGELDGKPIEVLVPDSARQQHIGHRNNYHKKPGRRLMGEGRELFGKKKDGTLFPIEISLTTAMIEGEQVAIAYINNIAERLKTANALKESEAQLAAIIDNASDGIISIEKSGAILSINQAAARIFGYQQEEVFGKNIKMLMPEPDHSQHDQYLENYHTTGVRKIIGIGREVTGRKKDGTHFPLHLNVSEVAVKGGIIYTAVLRDLTVREALNTQIELNELKSRFVSMASHEFRTPLTSILSSVSIIKRYSEKGIPEKQNKHILRIQNSVKNLTSILNDFLSLEKLESGKVNLNISEIDLTEFVAETIEDLEPTLKEGQQILHAHTGENKIIQDAHLLKNILFNLLSNAVKYSPNGEDITINSSTANQKLTIEVIDQGIGIPLEDQKHMFTRFFRANNVINIKGTGLGLTIVKRYIDLMEGDIGFKSTPGEGSCFTVNIPQQLKLT